jgi:hypothetical protein
MLGWQYYFTYTTQSSYLQAGESSSILFAPFAAVSSNSNFIGVKFLCSIIFPLFVTITFGKRLKRYPEYFLALLIFIWGSLYFYLLAEPGVYLTQQRFLWSASIGLFLWFLTSMRVLISEGGIPFMGRPLSRSVQFCYAIFIVSVACGIVKYCVDAGWLSRLGVGL